MGLSGLAPEVPLVSLLCALRRGDHSRARETLRHDLYGTTLDQLQGDGLAIQRMASRVKFMLPLTNMAYFDMLRTQMSFRSTSQSQGPHDVQPLFGALKGLSTLKSRSRSSREPSERR